MARFRIKIEVLRSMKTDLLRQVKFTFKMVDSILQERMGATN